MEIEEFSIKMNELVEQFKGEGKCVLLIASQNSDKKGVAVLTSNLQGNGENLYQAINAYMNRSKDGEELITSVVSVRELNKLMSKNTKTRTDA